MNAGQKTLTFETVAMFFRSSCAMCDMRYILLSSFPLVFFSWRKSLFEASIAKLLLWLKLSLEPRRVNQHLCVDKSHKPHGFPGAHILVLAAGQIRERTAVIFKPGQ